MMGDNSLSERPSPVEFLNVCLGDNLQPHPGVHPRGACSHPDPPEPLQGQTWASDSPESMRQDSPSGGCGTEPTGLGDGFSQRNPSRSTSAQVVFWAGILQAQMCVLDLEEELEKTEELRAELRSCLPMAPAALPSFSSSQGSPLDTGLLPSPPAGEALEEDGSSPEGEGQDPVRLAEGTPGSSLEWGAEEERVFCDNPLFLESSHSDSASIPHFSRGLPDASTDTRPESPLLLRDGVPWGLEDEPDSGDGSGGSSGCTTPSFPVPIYQPHCWTQVATTDRPPTAPRSWGDSETSLADSLDPEAPLVDEALIWETGHVGSDPSPGPHPVRPRQALPSAEGWQTGRGPSWLQVPLISKDRSDRDAEYPQDSAPCTSAPGPWGCPASSLEPGSPESVSRGPSPRPSPESSREGSPQSQGCHSGSIFPERTGDAAHPSLLETDEAEPSSLERREAEEALGPAEEVKSERAGQPDVSAAASEGLPESPTPHMPSPEEGQSQQAGDKLANGVRSHQLAWDLASRLYRLEGFRKSEVAAHLQKNNDFSRAVAQEYLGFFQFGGQSLDHALRGFLQALVLSGETQERERVLYQFSRRFHHCNPGLFPSVDSVHTLTCATMLLNTDLHGQNIGRSMSCQEFISNLNGLQEGGNFPKELLKALYWSIRSEKLEWAVDEDDAARPEKARPAPQASKTSSPLLQLVQDPTVPTYKQGVLARKMHHDADGKKTPWGKRGWKMFHTLLRGMALYFLKGEDYGPEGQMVDEPVGVHHSLATPATHYTKKPHVFQLRTADWRLYLFQAPTAKEMSSWIARINLAAATHSAPPFPAAVGSQRRFVRPILPAGPAQSSLEEQHRSHENCLDAASDDLLDLQRNLPEGRSRSRELEEYRLRKEHLEHEKTRYETYLQLLVARLHCPADDLDLWEEQLGREAGGTQGPKPGLKKSHSSPSLHQDEAPTTAKVKRNVSERRTYRKVIPRRGRHQL
ncbi:PH and SEC7 domain-containing protein 4 isoform X1 [Rousettus aegyptiacus]|uniref:PH and SEC7 domain-containing protein 4 n=2 Tax=Rousettus aegyptiacus TaxID=9407 RepID=A0A7J8FLM2_ROUAE|nr:PH and SEC7 domain-containing protein 4 isoform X1 [Rousettus aegyptiacus]XP_016008537.2 PH and SEC7 domain-containing protein 4 isoform X1 [Rousettus aegyptiacus]XP_036080663.1 PH and SEC7 domain-containing protein 4 isoform X1 [Rousettus aegyptiacus]KAF6448480.1 pleckstrin and Sec7 domain containing 4 [Rousettus aegyptiacus]